MIFGMLNTSMTFSLTACIKVYQMIASPFMPKACRFYPSCSQYALEAVEIHGPGKGLVLATKRVLKCHPLNEGGLDPVPVRSKKSCLS